MSNSGPIAISIVAKSKTGKTTLLEGLIPALKRRRVRLAVVKHHHHQSSFDTEGKDTWRMAEAGADVVIGASPVQLATFRRLQSTLSLEDVVAAAGPDIDLVLTEGFKSGPFPKIEVHRAARSDQLLCAPDELLALVTDRTWDIDVPQFPLDDYEAIADHIVSVLANRPG